MHRRMSDKTRRDIIRKEYVRDNLRMASIDDKIRENHLV